MSTPDLRVTLIVATDRAGVIGIDGRLPWHLPADLAHFKRTTMGKPIIMGRKTYASIGRPLPGRTSIVLTRSPGFVAEGCVVVHDVDAALRAAASALAADAADREAMVIGGAEIYRLFLPRANRIQLTRIDATFDGDTQFPVLEESMWTETRREDRAPDERNPYPIAFITLERMGGARP